MKREDFCFRSFTFSFLSHRKRCTVKGGRGKTKEKSPSVAQPNLMSSSEDNESKSYPELDESALLVAQVKLSCVFEI